jgi:hypothetical protein
MKKGTYKTVQLGHADRIFKTQRDRNYPKDACWELVKEVPEKKSKDKDRGDDKE